MNIHIHVYFIRYIQPDCIGNRIEDWELDPKLISKSHSIDENTKKLLNDHIKERLKSVYQISYKNPCKFFVISRDLSHDAFVKWRRGPV